MKAQDYQISSEKFVFHTHGEKLHDTKLETKPISYMRDAFNRFCRNKGSILAAIVIGILVLFALIGPLLTPFTVAYEDKTYAFVLPRNELFVKMGIPFWDGGQEKEVNKLAYDQYRAIEEELGRKLILSEPEVTEETYMGQTKTLYTFRLDTYNAVGAKYVLLSTAEYEALQRYQDANQVQVILPATNIVVAGEQQDKNNANVGGGIVAQQDKNNANIWFRTKLGKGNKTEIVYAKDGGFIPVYRAADGKDGYTSTMFWEGDTKQYNYAIKMQGDQWRLRVDYKEYYTYLHTEVYKDGITEPSFILGTDNNGHDIFTRLASGARFSLLLAIIVASVNLIVGAIYGSIEGYYGGKIDLVMERIVDLLGSIPFMIVITLMKYHFNVSHVIILFMSFFLTGWTGMAGRTRMQFYRFKNQEYVLVARTLGAGDRRIMFKHIFPNAIGTLITGSVLVIPGVIFSETSLSYLGIINLDSGNMTSVGTLLSTGQNYLFTYPHIILFPAIFISLLMLCFNLFGNGLRDAFNPSLRGSEE